MRRSNRVLQLTSFCMIAIGIFSIVTGFLSALGYSEAINDYVGDRQLFNFINGGVYFVICGIIHVLVSIFALHKIKNMESKLICVIIGLITLAWQLAAFIYLLTLSFLSLRAGLMVIFPAIYLTSAIISAVKERTVLVDEKGETTGQQPKISTPKNFFRFNFSFRRKSIDGLFQFNGKRKSFSVGSFFNIFQFGRRHNSRINLKPRRRFKTRRR